MTTHDSNSQEGGKVELLPCPFCGARADQPKPSEPHGGMVYCTRCGAGAFGPKWNCRVSPTPSQEGRSSLSVDALREALNRAYQLGQAYWRQADSDSYKQNRLADETQAKFDALRDQTLAALEQA